MSAVFVLDETVRPDVNGHPDYVAQEAFMSMRLAQPGRTITMDRRHDPPILIRLYLLVRSLGDPFIQDLCDR